MIIKTFGIKTYKDCPIYFRNFGTTFEYLAIINNQIYTAHLTIRPTFLSRLYAWTGIEPEIFSEDEMTAILKKLNTLAETTIDYVLENKK